MRHFDYLSDGDVERLFFQAPAEFTVDSPKNLLSSALGATLYTPSIMPNLAEKILKNFKNGARSSVMCLEDSIPDDRVEEGEQNIVRTLQRLQGEEDLPLLFIRVRTPEHLVRVAEQNRDHLSLLTGFVFPKFDNEHGDASRYVQELTAINRDRERNGLRRMLFMPVLESPSLVFRETRDSTLYGIKEVLSANRDTVLAVRIGATDMSSSYALRRSADLTVYNVHVVASAIADIVNVLGRAEDGHVITGAVWEHFSNERILKPQLRETPFLSDRQRRRKLVNDSLDSLIKEIIIDRANGILGKTVIHPTHIPLVHSLSVVSHEEYCDALEIAGEVSQQGGAKASQYKNKMNEIKPHLAWAQRTLLRAKAFGVSNPKIDFVDFLEASDK